MTTEDRPAATASPRRWRWNGLWRQGAGTPDDPNNGRLIFRLTGFDAVLYCRRFDTKRAMLRGIYWRLVRRYETELCQHCGRPVLLVYHAPDAIWEAVTGLARHPDGHAAPGILCPVCFDDLAEAKGLPYLRWTCATSDEVLHDTQTTSTLDEPGPGLLLNIRPDGDGYIVKDMVGLRYGHGSNVSQAMAMWAEDVQWLLTEPREKLGPPLLDEADRYRKALPNG